MGGPAAEAKAKAGYVDQGGKQTIKDAKNKQDEVKQENTRTGEGDEEKKSDIGNRDDNDDDKNADPEETGGDDPAAAKSATAAIDSLSQLSAMYESSSIGIASPAFNFRGPAAEAKAKAGYVDQGGKQTIKEAKNKQDEVKQENTRTGEGDEEKKS